MSYTFNKLDSGSIEIFKDGQRFSTGTASLAADYGYKAGGSTPTPTISSSQGSTAINTNFQLLPGESLASYSARVTPLGGIAPSASQFTKAGGNVAGTPQIAPNTGITPAGLTSPTPINIPQATGTTGSGSYVANIGTQSGQLQAQIDAANTAVTEEETKKTSTYNDYITSLQEYATKGASQTEAETTAGIPQQQKELANLNSQVMAGVAEYNQLKGDYDRMSLENRARSATMSRVIGREAAIDFARVQNLNGKASDIGLLQAQALGKSGQIEAAQKSVDKAVDLKYEDKLSRIKILEAQLASISADLTKDEKVKADLLTKQYDLQTQSIADAKATEKSIQSVMLEAAKSGATAETLSAISKSTTVEDAINLAAKYVKAPADTIGSAEKGFVQWNPETGRYDIAVMPQGGNTSGISSPTTDIVSILSGSKIGQTTKTVIGTIMGVINAAETMASNNPGGKFGGISPLNAFLDDARIPFTDFGVPFREAFKSKAGTQNTAYIEAINLKVQQWASGAALTDKQTEQVARMVPTTNDTDTKVQEKLNNLIDIMQQQIRGSLQAEGIVYKPTNSDLFASNKSLADIFK